MRKVAIITDSNSGISQDQAKSLNITVLPMPFTINAEEHFEETTMSHEQFYEHLKNNANVSTSQPSEYMLTELWEDLLKEYDEILHIPMSSGLSRSCENAKNYAERYKGKVYVVDNKRISVTLKESVFQAIEMVKQGKKGKEIKEILEKESAKNSIYITMGVLKYLKKGGRISPAAALLGDVLKLKPILSSTGDKFEKFNMALSLGQAKKKMISQVKNELDSVYKDAYDSGKIAIYVAHTENFLEAEKFAEEVKREFPKAVFRSVDKLSLSVACHIGPGALALAYSVNNLL